MFVNFGMATDASADTLRPVYYIGSRKSELAMHQTLYVQSLLQVRIAALVRFAHSCFWDPARLPVASGWFATGILSWDNV